MSYIAWFKDIDENSLGVAGGKGTNLGIMFKLGLPVPPGFAVTAQTYKEYLDRSKIKQKIEQSLQGLDVENNEQLQQVAVKIQSLIVSTPIPQDIAEEIEDNYELLGAEKGAHSLVQSKDVFVAVRSSATAEDLPEASFAGQQATFLNIKGKDNVVAAVLACWASLFTARAIYYREKNKFAHMDVLISAIVQKMVNSEKSGIMFTINPSTNAADEIVIEGVYGLGEMIVGGEVNPNLYIVDKKTMKIKKREIKKQEYGLFRNERGDNVKVPIPKIEQEAQAVPDALVIELARLGKKIEDHYGKPQDIEWAIEGRQVYIVQSRAVTTFKKKIAEAKPALEEGRILLKGETASAGAYTGAVKIVKDPSELNKVLKGDVMVTRMTTPDMVPAMQRAGAIVTDEGGMTCHAAIVSREMGTPCIVGTEHATEVLKDNEIITVNASRGIVYEGQVEVKKEEPKVMATMSNNNEDLITATSIKVIMDLPDLAQRVAATGADGVGLVRLEIMIANGGIHPAE